MTLGYPGTFPGGLTTGFLIAGAAQKSQSTTAYPGTFPGSLTVGHMNTGAVQKNPNSNYVDTFSDSVTATDTIAGLMQGVGSLADSVTGADTQSGIVNYLQTLSDSVTGSDTQSVAFAGAASFSDPVTASDSQAAAMATAASFSDSATGSDTMIGGIGYFNTISDSIASSDAMSGVMYTADAFSGSVAANDTIIGGIGYFNTISDNVTPSDSFQLNPQPNIILSGTLDFGYSFRIPHQIKTFLNFGLLLGDDNLIQINVNNLITGAAIFIVSANVYIYAPGTTTNPVITKVATPALGNLQFSLEASDVEDLTPGLYPWIAVVALEDGTHHIVNCGDINLTTGVINIMARP